MKNTIKGFVLATAAIFGLGLFGCQNNDAPLNPDNTQGEKEHIIVEAIIDNDTRATLTQSKDILKLKWETDDAIEVVNASTGKHLGTLRVFEVIDETKCRFSGDIDPVREEATLNLFYLSGREMTLNGKTPINLPISFASQNGKAESFNDYNVMIGTKANYISGTGGKISGVKFKRNFAYGYFVLKVNGAELPINGVDVKISANTGTLYNNTTIDFDFQDYSQVYLQTEEDKGEITITKNIVEGENGSADNSFFVNLLPTSAVNLKFSCKVNNIDFVGTIGSAISTNMFYSNNGEPIVVEMEMANSNLGNLKIIYDADYDTNPRIESDSYYADGVTETSHTFTIKDYSELTTLAVPTDCTFKGWSQWSTSTKMINFNEYTLEINGNWAPVLNLYAVWEATCRININYNDNKTLVKEQSLGDKLLPFTYDLSELETPQRPGYKFKGWATDSNGENIITTVEFTPTSLSQTIYAVWDQETHTVGINDYEYDSSWK